jgi:transposase
MGVSVGVDLHKGQFTVYWRRQGDPVGRWERCRTNELGYQWFEGQLKKLREEGQEVRVAVESTANTRYFKRRVEALGIPVVVINTMKFKVVTESVKKTDRRDAATIAEFLEKDMLPQAKLCSTESEELRRVLKARTVLAIKNQVHGLLLSLGIEAKRGSLQSQEGRRRVLNVLAEHGLAGQAVEPLLQTIDRLEVEVKKLEKILEQKVQEDRVVELLQTIPGAGLITASTIRAYVDDIERFLSYKQFSAYAGLVPWVQNSNATERYGSITKRGPCELRTALVQVVLGMVRNKRATGGYRLMGRYAAMKKEKGSGKAIIATARKLSKIVWYMLRNDAPFDPQRMTDPGLRKIARAMQAGLPAA